MMYCANCKTEYRDGFTRCADCQATLVAELPLSEEEPKFVDLEEVLTSNNPGQIALVKSVLDAEEIPYLAQGEHFYSMRPHVPVRFLVSKEHIVRAREVLKDLL